ncbi:MAG TPA: ABC transporter permease [Acidimicrobiales bacterium]|nr:ABC transporter permease [Acidimicrobiales bacterium]
MQALESQALAPSRLTPPPKGVHRIQPSRWLVPVDPGELWRYRQLVWFFVLRDVKARYRQTYLGPTWAILRPLLTIVVFSAIFGGLAGISPGKNTDIPYALWVTPGVLAFTYISTALSNTSTSLVTNANLLTKVYFPRLYVPVATTLTPVVDLLLGFLVLFGLFGYFHRAPSWHIVFLPAFFVLAALIVAGVGLWLASFTARYRDAVFGVPFLVQIWQYATPVIYPAALVPEPYRRLLDLNPFTAVVDGFRWSLLGLPFGSLTALATSLGIALALVVTGLFVFRRTERFMVDML